MSDSRVTDVACVAELLVVSGSVSLALVTVAVLLITSVPAATDGPTVRATDNVAEASLARSPSVQTVPPKVPALGVTETTTTPEGRVITSDSATSLASDGPLFLIVTT
jgi:hypothetical protein